MRTNHLLEPISCLLELSSAPLSEYELIQQLQAQGYLTKIPPGDTLALYSTHFLVYNALYQLQDRYRVESIGLVISALSIHLVRGSNSSDEGEKVIAATDSGNTELRAYYLDWENLESSTQASVDQLLNSFWQYFVDDADYGRALQVLGVDATADYGAIKQRYRQLAMSYHPDRGGNAESFQNLHQAFSLIQRRYQ